MKSKFLNLGWKDLVKGIVVAIVTAMLTAVYDIIQTGGTITLKNVAVPAILALISYLLKNLFTNSQDEFKQEPKPVSTQPSDVPGN